MFPNLIRISYGSTFSTGTARNFVSPTRQMTSPTRSIKSPTLNGHYQNIAENNKVQNGLIRKDAPAPRKSVFGQRPANLKENHTLATRCDSRMSAASGLSRRRPSNSRNDF